MTLTPLEPWIARKIGQAERPLSRAALQAYQFRKLRATIRLAREHSPFYHKHLAAAPADLASPADLTSLPFTSAGDIRAHPLQLLCVSQDDIQRVVTLDSSGTTGSPKRIYFTRDDQELTVDFFQVGMSTFTAPGDRVLILLPGETPGSVGDLLASALQRLGAHPIKYGPVRDPAHAVAVAAQEQATVIVGVPTHVLKLARHAPAGVLKLTSVLLTTDHVPTAIVRATEQAWGCTVFNHYGMTEMGLGGGVDCGARRGYHLREADLYFEVVDPNSGRPVADGEAGEVVFTTLTRRGMPLIRYRTGDLGRFVPEACPCGTTLKTLEHITTRVSGRVELCAGSLLTMADLDEALFPIESLLDFSAMLIRGDKVGELRIEAQMCGATTGTVVGLVQSAIESIAAVRRARAMGTLHLAQVRLKSEPLASPGAAKRAIRIVPAGDRGAPTCSAFTQLPGANGGAG